MYCPLAILKHNDLVLVWSSIMWAVIFPEGIALNLEPILLLKQLSLFSQPPLKGKETIKDGGLANTLVTNHHQLRSKEWVGIRGAKQIKQVLNKLFGSLLSNIDWNGFEAFKGVQLHVVNPEKGQNKDQISKKKKK